ncbi:sensor histidine kinase [Pseudomonas sp. RIT-To-2]|uniref:sensor histidine kinase n=1 Tax=Pseudomonas sp. RIT-To-2 TaxID=3462541 RepID=UPI0024136ECE
MKLPGRGSVLWKLCALLATLMLLVIWLSRSWGMHFEREGYRLSDSAQQALRGYAAEAEAVWSAGGPAALGQWEQRFSVREPGWAVVLGADMRPLDGHRLNPRERHALGFAREIDWAMSARARGPLLIKVAFPIDPSSGQLVLQLPDRFVPGMSVSWQLIAHWLVPAALSLLIGALLYRLLIGPLAHLHAHANALREGRLETRLPAVITRRADELGDLGRTFDHMADRLQQTVALQRRLLRDMSHELRTPLSRLQVAVESDADAPALRQRLAREVQCMRQLVDDTLELVWLDTERPQLALDSLEVGTLWEMLREDACFESGWTTEQMPNELGGPCWVRCHLNGLAQAMENILRNAIRHSPAAGQVRLGGRRETGHWHLWIDDQGPGVAEQSLEGIFEPFTRLNASRPGGDGFGLGLTIARCRVQLQGGELWAQNLNPGLRLNLRLPAA